jgi:glycosyltransferase involved in cell wall biosynthesis
MIIIISDSLPTKSFKRSGIFGLDDYNFFRENGNDIKMIVLYRITYERRFLFDLKNKIDLIRTQIREIKELAANNPNIEFIPYYSLIKPLVFKEDLFLFKKSKFNSKSNNLVIVHNMLHTGLNINWIRKQFPCSKVILKEHSDWLLFPKLIRYFAVKYVGKYDKILANSEFSKRTFQKIFTTYNSTIKYPIPSIEIDYPKFKINTKRVVKSKSDCLRILTVADLLKIKGFTETFDILQILEDAKIDWKWTIIGKGIFYNDILRFARDLNFLNKISILTEVQKPELFGYMIESDLYLQLSYRETFGIAPIEAFSYYNKLIVSSHITSVNELGLSTNNNVLIINNIAEIFPNRYSILNFISKEISENDYVKTLPELNAKINMFPEYK